MRASQSLRQGALALVFVLLAACGGSNDGGTTTADLAPTASATYASTVPATAVATLDASGSTQTSGGTLTYNWALTSVPAGSAASIASPTAVQTTLTTDLVGIYTLTLTVSDGLKAQSVSFSISAVAQPAILSDLVEPVSGAVVLSLSNASAVGTNAVVWTVDGTSIGTGATVTWDTTHLPDGSHVVAAQVQSVAKYVFNVSRTFQVVQSPVSFNSATITESAGLFIATVGAQSANGIQHVDGSLDGVALGGFAAPNACIGDATGAACAATGLNGYQFRGTLGSGAHTVVITATDVTGRTLGTQLLLNVTDVP